MRGTLEAVEGAAWSSIFVSSVMTLSVSPIFEALGTFFKDNAALALEDIAGV